MEDTSRDSSLSSNDNAILSKLFDPESAPSSGVLVDASLPSDPHVVDAQDLATIKSKEKRVIQSVESVLQDPRLSDQREDILASAYAEMSILIDQYPRYASLRNNRAQLFRLRYGDEVLVPNNRHSLEDISLAATALQDLNTAISVLTPTSTQSPISPAQCQTLAQAHTQRGALYYAAAKALDASQRDQSLGPRQTSPLKPLESWTTLDFEEAASKDFFMGGRYGNEIGKALAVHCIAQPADFC